MKKVHLEKMTKYLSKVKDTILEKIPNEHLQKIFLKAILHIKDKIPEIVVIGPTGGGKTSIVSWLVRRDIGVSADIQGPLNPQKYDIIINDIIIKEKENNIEYTVTDMGGFGGVNTHKLSMRICKKCIKNADLVLFVSDICARDLNFKLDVLKKLLTSVKNKTGIDIPVIFVATKVGLINDIKDNSRDILKNIKWGENDNGEFSKYYNKISDLLIARENDFKSKFLVLADSIPVDCYIPEKSNWSEETTQIEANFWNMTGLLEHMAMQAGPATRAMFWRILLKRHKSEKKFISMLIKHIINDTIACELIGQKTTRETVDAFIAIAMQYLPQLLVLWTPSNMKMSDAMGIFEKLRPSIGRLFIKHKIKYIKNAGYLKRTTTDRVSEPEEITDKFLQDQLKLALKLYRDVFVNYADEQGIDKFPSEIDHWDTPKVVSEELDSEE